MTEASVEKAIREEWTEGSCDHVRWECSEHPNKLCYEEFARNVLKRFSEDERRISKPSKTRAEIIHNFRCDIENAWGISNVMSEDIADRAQIFWRIGKNEYREKLREKIKTYRKELDNPEKMFLPAWFALDWVLKVLDDAEMEK